MRKIATFFTFLLIIFVAGESFAANPKLFFSQDDITALRAKRYEPHILPIWQNILARADAYCTPGSSSYVDPESSWFVNGDYGWYGRDVQSWVETIGFVYQITGNSFYGNHGAAILAASADYVAPQGSLLLMNIDMMRTFATGYDWLYSAMTPQQRTKIEQRAKDYIEWSFTLRQTAWAPYHNFTGVAFGGTGLLAIALEDVYPVEAPVWMEQAKEQVVEWFDKGFDAQGAYVEGHYYSYYGLSNAIAFADALKRNKQINIMTHPHLENLANFFAMTRLPGTDIYEGRNDSDYLVRVELSISRLAQEFDDGLLKWFWERAQTYMMAPGFGEGGYYPDYHRSGYSPLRILWDNNVVAIDVADADLPLSEHFEQRGLVTFRSGWGVNDTLFTIEAGQYYYVTHNQSDKGHFSFYGLGYNWAVDSGTGQHSTLAHNCILINGAGQAVTGNSGYGSDGEIVTYVDNPNYGYALADATSAYNVNNLGVIGNPVEYALRHSVYVRRQESTPAYAVILDDIKKGQDSNGFTWQLMSANDMDIRFDGDNPKVIPIKYVSTPKDSYAIGSVVWTVDVPESGTYSIWGKVSPDVAGISASDSFVVQVNGMSDVHWHFTTSSNANWRWDKVVSGTDRTPVSFELTAGINEIKVKTREELAKISAIFISTDTDAQPPYSPTNAAGIYLNVDDAVISSPMEFYEGNAAMQVIMDAAAPISYAYDYYSNRPKLLATSNAVNPKFISVLIPHNNEQLLPQVEFSDFSDGRKVSVLWQNRIDEITLTSDGVDIQIGRCMVEYIGDVNRDCVVDFADFAILASAWMNCSDPQVSDCYRPIR